MITIKGTHLSIPFNVEWLTRNEQIAFGYLEQAARNATDGDKVDNLLKAWSLYKQDLDSMPIAEFKSELFDILVSNHSFERKKGWKP